jgi:hypothetical protein
MKQIDLLAGFAIIMFLISLGITVAVATGLINNALWASPVSWWLATCINAHSIISRLAMSQP